MTSCGRRIIPLVASIDVGTTSSRVIFFNKHSQAIFKHQIEYTTNVSNNKQYSLEGTSVVPSEYLTIKHCILSFPRPGWVQINPAELLNCIVECFSKCLSALNAFNTENEMFEYQIKCMGVANMRETTMVWSKSTGKPIVPVGIVWNDTRTSEIIKDKEKNTCPSKLESVKRLTGLPLSTYFLSSKLVYFIKHYPEVKKAYEEGDMLFGTVDTYLLYNLTSQSTYITDVTNASRYGFMDIEKLKWCRGLVDFWGLDFDKLNLPEIKPCAGRFGTFRVPSWMGVECSNLNKLEIPVTGIIGDQSASLVGQLGFDSGNAKCTYGTGCFMLYNTGTSPLLSKHGALSTVGYYFPNLKGEVSKPHYALEGSIAVAGSLVQWLRDNLKLISKSEEIGPMANTVTDTGGVAFVPAFSGLFAPYWDPNARGTIIGISQYTTGSHIARAALEGVCFQAKAILEAMESDAYGSEAGQDNDNRLLSVDGGMSKSNEVLQIQADILGPKVTIRRANNSECTALGAAIAANMGFESEDERPLWKDLDDVKNWILYGGNKHLKVSNNEAIGSAKVFICNSTEEERDTQWKMWTTAVNRSRGWLKDIN